MTNRFYDIKQIDEGVFTVLKKSSGTVYHITKLDDGSWVHECKIIQVKGNDYLCRHKKMIIQMFYVDKEYKSRFNLTPKRKRTE